jgi:hypothetical protein
MNTSGASSSMQDKLGRVLEGLVGLTVCGLVLGATIAICFPTAAVAG